MPLPKELTPDDAVQRATDRIRWAHDAEAKVNSLLGKPDTTDDKLAGPYKRMQNAQRRARAGENWVARAFYGRQSKPPLTRLEVPAGHRRTTGDSMRRK